MGVPVVFVDDTEVAEAAYFLKDGSVLLIGCFMMD